MDVSKLGLHKKTILIIDDDLLLQKSIFKMLVSSKINFIAAPNATIGIQLAQQKLPDIILLDWNMPNLSGIDALKLLKQNPTTAHIPIIMMTAVSTSSQNSFQALSTGADDFLRKPFDQPELIGRLCNVLRLYQANAKIAKQNVSLRKLSDDKSKLLSVISHDLKSPLNNIEGLVHLLGREFQLAPEKQQPEEYIKLITKIIQQERTMIDKVLEMHEYEEKQLTHQLEAVDLVAITKQVVGNYQHNKKQIEIKYEADQHKLIAHTNIIYIKKIVDNLLSNAVKYSLPNTSVEVTLEDQTNYVYLSIKDHGQGFHPSEVEKVFQDFGKFSAKPTGGESSSGIGLYIVKSIIDRLDGRIQLKSTYGKGSEFIVLLPKQDQNSYQQKVSTQKIANGN